MPVIFETNEMFAKTLATSIAFDSTGRFEGDVDALIQAIRSAFELAGEYGSRAVEAAVADLMEGDSPFVLSDLFNHMRLQDVPEAFDALVAKCLVARKKESKSGVIHTGELLDWRVKEGISNISDEDARPFSVKACRQHGVINLNVVRYDESGFVAEHSASLALSVEVSEGLPCVHIYNDIDGDVLLTISATHDGLVLESGAVDSKIDFNPPVCGSMVSNVFASRKETFADVYKECSQDMISHIYAPKR